MKIEHSSPRRRILHVYKDYYPPVMGGVEMTINLLAEGCLDEFDVTVLVNSASRGNNQEIINGVRVVRVSEWGRAASAPVSPAFISALKREAYMADVLHFHHPNPTGDLARFLSRPTPPAVMTYHSDVVRQKWAMTAYGPLQDWMMKNCRVIMPTSANYLESSRWLKQYKDRCQVVPLGIRIENFRVSSESEKRAGEIRVQYNDKPLILFVGRLRYYKGLQYLIKAVPELRGDVVIVGSGPMEAELRRLAEEIGVSDRVHFTGDVSDDEKLAYYYAADVFCMPSHLRSEAFGLSQVEAMSTGLPVVSCDIPSGVPFVNLDGESGITVEPENPAALAGAINSLLTDNDLRERLGLGAHERARKMFSARRMCEDVKAVYRSVLSGGK